MIRLPEIKVTIPPEGLALFKEAIVYGKPIALKFYVTNLRLLDHEVTLQHTGAPVLEKE